MKANQPREHAARVRFHLERFEQTGRVILVCVDNNMIISHRDKKGWMVATYPCGTAGRRRLSLGRLPLKRRCRRPRRWHRPEAARARHRRSTTSSTRSNGISAWMAPGPRSSTPRACNWAWRPRAACRRRATRAGEPWKDATGRLPRTPALCVPRTIHFPGRSPFHSQISANFILPTRVSPAAARYGA